VVGAAPALAVRERSVARDFLRRQIVGGRHGAESYPAPGIPGTSRSTILTTLLRGSLSRGDRLFVSWGHPEQPLFKATLAAVSESSSQAAEPTPPGSPGPFRFAAPGGLSTELQRAEFSAVSEEHRQIPWPFLGSVEELWEMFTDLAGPSFRRTMSAMGPAREQELVRRIILNLRQFRQGELVDPTALVVGCSGVS
jgi:hypothetical protein